MTISIGLVLLVLISVVIVLFLDKYKPAAVLFTANIVFLLAGIIQPADILVGFSNTSIGVIVLLIILASALSKHFDIEGWFEKIFSQSLSARRFHNRLTLILSTFSGFVNNTPIVAMALPHVYQWAKSKKIAPSKFLMSLSFASMLGGIITVIGTSTNLVLLGLIEEANVDGFSYLEFSSVGVVIFIVGILFLNTVGFHLMPDKSDLLDEFFKHTREYLVETKLSENSVMIGKSITEAGLRELKSGFLLQINRNGRIYSPVDPSEILEKDDILYFSGDREIVFDILRNKSGLELNDQTKYFTDDQHIIFEVVVARNSAATGKSVKDLKFRKRYESAILAVHRNGEIIQNKIGDLILLPGDMLLLISNNDLSYYDKYMKDFYVVSQIGKRAAKGSKLKTHLFGLLSFALILLAFAGFIKLFSALLFIISLMFVLGLYGFEDLKKDINLSFISILAFSLTFGNALFESGAADFVAGGLFSLLQNSGLLGILTGLFITTAVLTSFVTNVAAVTIMFPIALSLQGLTHFDSAALFLCIAFGASAAFINPIGYQTNLMVFGPGGYTFKDFFRVGFPLTIVYGITCIATLYFKYSN